MGEVFSWVLFPVDSFTGLVVPTTCSLTTCLTTCMVYPYVRRSSGEVYPYVRRIEWGSVPVCSWKTPTNHQLLWKTPAIEVPESACSCSGTHSDKSDFAGGTRRRF